MLNKILRKLIKKFEQASRKSKLVRKGESTDLYKTHYGFLLWLDQEKYLDRYIIENGVFEPDSSYIVNHLIKPGDVVLDVGANIGYYTVLFARLVKKSGKVICFEPSEHYRKLLKKNIEENELMNVSLMEYGLSDRARKSDIHIGDSSATLHWVSESASSRIERITLEKLDDVIGQFNPDKIDFIKVDIDGHEPAFLAGAWQTIERFNPVILLEISHMHYLEAGVTAWDFYDLLRKRGFHIYSEKTLEEYKNLQEFLKECGNFAYSANILISLDDISNKLDFIKLKRMGS